MSAAQRALATVLELLIGDRQADRAVPPTGFTVWLTVLTAGAMAFLAVFALALTLATGRLADRWADSLAQAVTIRISAPAEQRQAQTDAVLRILETTPGVASARALQTTEQAALLEPWLGPDLPIDRLPLPRLVEVVGDDLDAQGLRLRLAAEVPGAILDDHTRWRAPLVEAASRLRLLGWTALILIAGMLGAMVTLGAQAALAANTEVIRVLRLVGARDAYVARAFTRRFTLRALTGAAGGALLGTLAVAALPSTDAAGGFLTGLSFAGWGWLLPLLIPPFAAITAFAATRRAALRALARFE
ncbi:cell division protein FtsX [Jannaschia pagri]|uniref:Cell division protein FtsX n=1 Tax=Jannaschia pagri TaxID=2829797 RepID=A0ABQ4NHB2_9RHOB|nr:MULTISPECIES: cell division protein FtsX [unclassified Jannaschia]GIT90065.1 cell division protein FtsX [Jannaschia sp. AI_61]GIT93829.1 cell division protein FtsX [Jannaschia sp. AI_62]